ncbi:MAG TPA: DUF3040 domain-containing protein [Mycobacteriales bacterium]
MPLSEHEQRLLEQIERALYAEDPKFASAVSSADLRTHARRRVRRAVALLVVGMVTLFVGVVVKSIALGVGGFCVMFLAAWYATTQYKRISGRPDLRVVGEKGTREPRARGRRTSFIRRMEERFRSRFDDR